MVRKVPGMLIGLVLTLLAAFPAAAQEAALSARVDRATIRENESFTYVLRAEGRITGQPDLSSLEIDFDLLNRSSSTRIQTINGRTEQVAEWTIDLMPRGAGSFSLPAIELGDLVSNSIRLEVLAAPLPAAGEPPADIFMEVEAEPAAAYVPSKEIYTLRLFTGVGIGRATLTAPLVNGGEAIVERLGEDRQFQSTLGTRTFVVRERRYAIFPQESGRLTLGPSTFEAMVIPTRGFSRVQRLRSETVELEVRPAVAPPATHPNAVWLPATNLSLSERWADQSAEFLLGVPRTRVLSIVADGLLDTQLPELELGQADGIRQYPDQPELEQQITERGIQATRTERYAVIAQAVGEVSIPAAEIPWWNVVNERWEIARIEPRVLPVVPGDSAEPEFDQPAVELVTAPAAEPEPGFWPWLSLGLGVGWLITAAVWLQQRPQSQSEAPSEAHPRRPSSRSLFKQLRAACAVNDPVRAQQLLLEWAAFQFSDSPPTSLGALTERMVGPLAEEVAALEAHLYGRGGAQWAGSRLARLLKDIDSVDRSDRDGDQDPLVPLYR